MKYEVFRQDVWEDEGPPDGDGWEPFAATAAMDHSVRGFPTVYGEIVWWRRPIDPVED